jgi:PTS system nitrogen regulatory IIA component
MELGSRQVAELLNISEKKLYQWITQKKIPVTRIGAQYRFNKAKLIEWAISEKIELPPSLFNENLQEAEDLFRLNQILEKGGIFYNLKGTDITSVLSEIVALMPFPEETDRNNVLQVLLARESMGSTGIGNGIAIPHVRNPIIMHITQPLISLCFLKKPIDFNSMDGKPVHTLFTIISPTPRTHLAVLARLSYALRDKAFSEIITKKSDKQTILAAAEAVEKTLDGSSSSAQSQKGLAS